MSPFRLAVLFDNFGPYHLARLAAAARHCEIVAVQARSSSHVYAWDPASGDTDYQTVTLYPDSPPRIMQWGPTCARIAELLDAINPDAIAVPGWAAMASLATAHWGLRNRKPLIVFSESNEHDFARKQLREWVKSLMLGAFTTALTGNESHRDYLVALGFDRDAVFLGYNAVDNDYFTSSSDAIRAAGMPKNGPGQFLHPGDFGRTFLATARFIEKKNFGRLLEAYAAYRLAPGNQAPWPLVLLGDGQLRPVLEAQIAALGLGDHVHLPGFVQYGDLPAWYASAGAFILPSIREQWGLVVNEAMASGLPVIVSNRCGCAPSLVEQDINGITFDPADNASLTAAMLQIAASNTREMGLQSRRIIAGWGPERFGKNLAAAAALAIERGPKSASPLRLMLLRAVAGIQEWRAATMVE